MLIYGSVKNKRRHFRTADEIVFLGFTFVKLKMQGKKYTWRSVTLVHTGHSYGNQTT